MIQGTRHRLRSTELPQSHTKATPKPHQSQLLRLFQRLGGAETACSPRVLAIMRIAAISDLYPATLNAYDFFQKTLALSSLVSYDTTNETANKTGDPDRRTTKPARKLQKLRKH